ncbi:MAG: tripartite tricarboxylate transporter substrate binding protein [Spirochaetales bacterium]|nr:tripartite tricarboxylate transporter substrate binding protein [Spirochaetales bacterium]
MKRLFLILLVLAAAAGFVLAEGTSEEAAGEYPTKAIQLIVPWPAGGRTDINARMFASVAPKYLGQPMVVVNKAGGASVIGGEYVAKAEPDGYTLMAITPGTNVFPVIFGQAPYDSLDFDAIGQIGSSTMAIASRPDRPFGNVRELISYARSHPGRVTYACVALKAPQLGFLWWADKAGLEFKHVPVGNDAEAVEAALGGHVDIAMTSSVATIISHVKGGNLNALMVFSEKRDANLPDTPTAVELGYDVVASPFTGIAGPKGMPPEVLSKLRSVFRQVMEDKDFITVMTRVGESLDPKFGDDFYAVWKNDKQGYGAIVEKMGLKQ